MDKIGIRTIVVNFDDEQLPYLSLVQGDAKTRGFDIVICDSDGKEIAPSDDYVVELIATGSNAPDTPYANRHTIKDGKYRVMIPTEALSKSGFVFLQLVFYQKSTGAVIHTIKQKCPVYQSIGQEFVESNNLYIDITALRLGLEKIEKLDSKYEEIIEKDIEIQANEIDRKEAEKKRNLDEEIRKDNENIRNSNEAKREQLKTELIAIKRVSESANADKPLYIPTYDRLNMVPRTNETTHPKVLYFPNRWNGYNYWMAHTPYPNGNHFYENPSVVCSNDGVRWVEPSGLVNPLQSVTRDEATSGFHYSDTHLVYREDTNILEIWYRYNKNFVEEKIFRQTSSNGVIWTDKELVLDLGDGVEECAYSPSIIFENGIYKMWSRDNHGKIRYRESDSDSGLSWSTPIIITMSLENSYVPWHLDVIKSDLGYEMLINSRQTGVPESEKDRRLHHSISTDGVDWSYAKEIMKPSTRADKWDNLQLYRSSILKINGLYVIHYGATSRKQEWRIGLTTGVDIMNLQGRQSQEKDSESYEYKKVFDRAQLDYPYLRSATLQDDLNVNYKSLKNTYIIKGRSDKELLLNSLGDNILGLNKGSGGDLVYYGGTTAPKVTVLKSGEIKNSVKGAGITLTNNTGGEYKISVNNDGNITLTNVTTNERFAFYKVRPATKMNQSAAEDVTTLRNEFNSLIARLKSAGLMLEV